MPGRSSNSANPNDNYKFTGHERDDEAGLTLMYAGARYLDNSSGRWLSVDPYAANYPSMSPYNYAGNQPINNYDPDGRFILSFLSGFARGIFSGKRVGESFNQGVGAVKNWANIWSSFGRGSFGQIASKLTWQLPQQLAGVLGGTFSNIGGRINSISHTDGATLLELKGSGWGAFTIGSVIQAQRDTEASFSNGLFTHEYGHYLQSQRLGPAYLPVIGLPSLGSAAINDYDGHEAFYTERWADRLSRKYLDRKFGKGTSSILYRYNELVDQHNTRLDGGPCAKDPANCYEDIFNKEKDQED